MKRYIFIGSVDFSASCLSTLLEMGVRFDAIMCPVKESCTFNSDYNDLSAVAEKYNKEVYYFDNIRNQTDFVRQCRPEVIFVLGLSQIVPKSILDIPTIGCIGSHPALLPYNRGRHPVIWALANGLRKSGITLFWLDEGIDSGDIWAQKKFNIDSDDDASTIYEKITDLSIDMLKEGLPQLEKGRVRRIHQDHSKANYLRKRTCEDGRIDWRMNSEKIYNLVRALKTPYPGAHCDWGGKSVKIWKTRVIQDNKRSQHLEPGKVVRLGGRNIVIKTGNGLIELLEHEFDYLPKIGDYL